MLILSKASSECGMVAKVSDFGLAKAKEDGTSGGSTTNAGGNVGTYAYMPPEVLDNDGEASDDEDEDDGAAGAGGGGGGDGGKKKKGPKVDRFKADVYSFGVLGFEMFARQVPFPGKCPFKIEECSELSSLATAFFAPLHRSRDGTFSR